MYYQHDLLSMTALAVCKDGTCILLTCFLMVNEVRINAHIFVNCCF